MLHQLIYNAAKFSPGKETVTVTLKKLPGFVQISISDQGVGIDPELLPKLFTPFFRTELTSANFQGLGLGLYISAEIIKKHGGTIWADNEENEGSTFHFTLPLSDTERA